MEDAYRKVIFMNNLKKFAEHNSDPRHSFKLGTGPLTALTQAEFELTYLNPKPFNPEWLESDLTVPEVTEDVDWTTKGIVSPVKVMGNCPAAWAFNAVASL
jgi:cathepsin L